MKKNILITCLSCWLTVSSFSSHAEEDMDDAESLGMVVSQNAIASEVGANILEQGGNAIDAMVATAYVLAVVEPCCGNLGGGGFMTIMTADKEKSFLDFRETAPAAVKAGTYEKLSEGASFNGYSAVAVPASVKGLNAALERYGSLPLEIVIAPAIKLAEDGFTLLDVPSGYHEAAEALQADPEAKAILFHEDGSLLKPGDVLRQADLAATLTAIQQQGDVGFYEGDVAESIASSMKDNDGFVSEKDLKNYTAIWRDPYECEYNGFTVITAPPPGSGAALCEMLFYAGLIEEDKIKPLSFDDVFLTGQSMLQAISDRNTFLADPDFVDVDTAPMRDPKRLTKIFTTWKETLSDKNKKLSQLEATTPEAPETTNIAVIDSDNNAVSMTYTLNGFFGTGIVAPGTGVLLNNEMDDFTTIQDKENIFGLSQGEQNQIAPGKRPASSMVPTILFNEESEVTMAIGSAGGSTIPTQILLAIKGWFERDLSIEEAITAPRYHQQSSQVMLIETEPEKPFSNQVAKQLEKHEINLEAAFPPGNPNSSWGYTNAIVFTNYEYFQGANDPRAPLGKAVLAEESFDSD